MNKKREAEIESKLDGCLKLLQERLAKTKEARKSAKKIGEEIQKLKRNRVRSRNRKKSAI